MTFVSAGHIIQIPTQPVRSGRLQRESNPGPPQQMSRALLPELPPPPPHTHTHRHRETERQADRKTDRDIDRVS